METEEALEDAYQSYLERRGARDAAARAAAAKRARLDDGTELAAEGDDSDSPGSAVCHPSRPTQGLWVCGAAA